MILSRYTRHYSEFTPENKTVKGVTAETSDVIKSSFMKLQSSSSAAVSETGAESEVELVADATCWTRTEHLYPASVSSGGENGSEAAHRLCGICRVQQSSTHPGCQHGGRKQR